MTIHRRARLQMSETAESSLSCILGIPRPSGSERHSGTDPGWRVFWSLSVTPPASLL